MCSYRNSDNHDFSNDNFEFSSGFVKFAEMSEPLPSITALKTEPEAVVRPKKLKEEKILIRVMTQDSVNTNPLSLIHDLRPDLEWEFIGCQAQGKVILSFKMMLKIDKKKYSGEGKTKKLAKYAASKIALLDLFGITLPEASEPTVKLPPKPVVMRREECMLLNQDLATRISAEVLLKSKSVFERIPELKKWTVLASILITRTDMPNWVDLICITTGTKCVKGDSLSMTGGSIHDCHAEILARRCFVAYLFKQLKSLIDHNFNDKPDNILRVRDDGYGFKLKETHKVHLFISTAPCGDARVFSPKEELSGDLHPNRMSRGVLRAKIEGGEGTIPVRREYSTLTWDGVVQGIQRVQFMSCSDKIALWNVVGLQGALLSHFIEPIYLESVILGSLFNYDHLVRAIQGRLNLNFESDSLKKLSNFYHLNQCKVAKSSVKEYEQPRQITKAPNYAVNYIKNDFVPEVISCDTGKIHKEERLSRLCKRTMFENFRTLLGHSLSRLPTSTLGSTIPLVYREAKTSAMPFQTAKLAAVRAFNEQNLGDWIQVPTEVDLFESVRPSQPNIL
ncbi:adenosine deaminase acting on RNA [Brevipalpus obovatus]|uniref:adenosine deaminase acting on RNA n=1 Tax=Brevipalpus obovatus TaxID=246614 RepID=UPI003D9EB65E